MLLSSNGYWSPEKILLRQTLKLPHDKINHAAVLRKIHLFIVMLLYLWFMHLHPGF